ncbi:MAG: hypothetical protein IJW23_03355 [Lentisphaeria bacterium]|nr:hypothetical protein [Lentisphaeria bacterium]
MVFVFPAKRFDNRCISEKNMSGNDFFKEAIAEHSEIYGSNPGEIQSGSLSFYVKYKQEKPK